MLSCFCVVVVVAVAAAACSSALMKKTDKPLLNEGNKNVSQQN